MTGGGTRAIPGAFNSGMSKQLSKNQSSTSSREDMSRFRTLVEVKQKEYDLLLAAQSSVNDEEYDLKNKLTKLIADGKSFFDDLKSLRAQVPLKEMRYKDQMKRTQAVQIDSKILLEKEKVLQLVAQEKETFEGPYEQVIDQIVEITSKLKDYQVAKKNKLEETVNRSKDTLKKVQDEKRKKELEIKNLQGNKHKLNLQKERFGVDILKFQSGIENLTKLKGQLKVSCEDLGQYIAQLQDKVIVSKYKRDQLKLVYESSTTESAGEKSDYLKTRAILQIDLNKLAEDLDFCKRKAKEYNDNLKGFKLKDIFDEFVEPLVELTDEEIENCQIKSFENQIRKYEEKLKSVGVPNLGILEEYRIKLNIYLRRVQELENLTEKMDKFKEAYQTTNSQRISEFMDGFEKISKKLKELFRHISLGGDAELELIDSTDPFSSGIGFSVRPFKKTWKKILQLSGGERTLSSLALIFALHHFKPSPFYILDEIDAALDYRNVRIISDYIKDNTNFTQFIVISLRSNMFEKANCLMGIYKMFGMSRCLPFCINGAQKRLGLKCGSEKPDFGPVSSETNDERLGLKSGGRNNSSEIIHLNNDGQNQTQNSGIENENNESNSGTEKPDFDPGSNFV